MDGWLDEVVVVDGDMQEGQKKKEGMGNVNSERQGARQHQQAGGNGGQVAMVMGHSVAITVGPGNSPEVAKSWYEGCGHAWVNDAGDVVTDEMVLKVLDDVINTLRGGVSGVKEVGVEERMRN